MTSLPRATLTVGPVGGGAPWPSTTRAGAAPELPPVSRGGLAGTVRRWITRHGGLSRHMIYLQGRELYAFVPSCERIAAHPTTRSAHRYRANPGRYDSASAASDRH